MAELAAQSWIVRGPLTYGEALAFLAPRMQGLELDGEPGYDSVHGIYGLLELPVRWNPV